MPARLAIMRSRVAITGHKITIFALKPKGKVDLVPKSPQLGGFWLKVGIKFSLFGHGLGRSWIFPLRFQRETR